MKELYGMFVRMEAAERGEDPVEEHSPVEHVETVMGDESAASPLVFNRAQLATQPRTVV